MFGSINHSFRGTALRYRMNSCGTAMQPQAHTFLNPRFQSIPPARFRHK
jgi:hypothetical protein